MYIKFITDQSLSELFDDDVADAKRNRKGARWVECVDQEKDPTFIPELPTEWDCEWKNIFAFDPRGNMIP